MTQKCFTKENTIKQRFNEREQLLKPFLEVYENPVLVHAVDKKSTFKKILEEGKLKLPKKHSSPKKTPYMEKYLGIDNKIYYSVGFVYLTAYNWKYNFIFDVHLLQDCKYYNDSINYQCYLAIINYWHKKDEEYLEKLANTNKQTRDVVNKYYTEEHNGKKRTRFEYWKIEKQVFEFIQKYPKQKEIKKIIKKIEQKLTKKYPSSLKDAKKAYLTQRAPEVIGLKDNNLKTNKHFLGFHINGKIPKDLKTVLKNKYPNKIIFDGKKIKKITYL
jgi:hypothetical protein